MIAVIDKRWSDKTSDRHRGDNPLFTPAVKDLAVPRPPVAPPPAAAERTMALPRLGPDGLPVTNTAATTPARKEAPTGVGLDNKLHAINMSVPSAGDGLWWSDCDRLVEFIPAREVAQLARDAWCTACWAFDDTQKTEVSGA